MKKFLATAALLLTLHALGMLLGCCTEHYTICLTLKGHSIANLDNRDRSPVPQERDTIPAVAYTLQLNLDMEEEYCSVTGPNWSPLGSALATSCEELFDFVVMDSITSLSITSLADFDAERPAGTELSALFIGPNLLELNGDTGEDYSYSYPSTYHFFLVEKPDAVRPHQFITTLTLASGTVFADTTEVVILSL